MKKESCEYISHGIQNECLALRILRDFRERIQTFLFFRDGRKSTGISNKEQFTICIRWVTDVLEVREDFVGLYSVDCIELKLCFGL